LNPCYRRESGCGEIKDVFLPEKIYPPRSLAKLIVAGVGRLHAGRQAKP
jgi:hypothetical protein